MADAQLLSLGKLLEFTFEQAPYWSYPLIPCGARMIIGGDPKSYKSMLALNIVYELAEGLPVLGLMPTTKKEGCKVLVVEQEIGASFMQQRMKKVHDSRQGQKALKNLHFLSKDHEIKLDTVSGLKKLIDATNEIKPDVLLLDPLRYLHSKDENDSTEIMKLFTRVAEIQAAHPGMTVIIVHHKGKGNEFSQAGSPNSLRGSSDLFGSPDAFIMIERSRKNEQQIELHFTLRHDEAPPKLKLQFDKGSLGFNRI